MYFRQSLLQLKRFLTAMILFAGGVVIVFSSVKGNDASADATEASVVSPVSNTVKSGTEKGNSETPNVDVRSDSGTPPQPEIQEERPVTTRPERSISIGIRKIYAPESEALRWPLGNKKYTYINAEKFESKYKLWKNILSDKSSDLSSSPTPPDAYIESARYYGTVSDSGELSGWGEWKVVVNNRKPEFKNEADSRLPSSRIISNAENGASTTNGNAGMRKTTESETGNVELYLTSEMKILLTDFVFYDASVENLPAPEEEPKTEESSPVQIDSEFRYPVEKNVISASFPGGRDVLYIPSSGTVRFRWKAKPLGLNDFQIQSFGSVESLWTLDVPSNQLLSVRSDVLEGASAPLCASVSKEKIEGSDSWRYSIRWSESDSAVVHIASADGKENRFERFYQQQTTYTFTPYHLNTQCRITFEPSSRFGLPQEMPFSVEHDPHVIWEASLDGQPAEIHITESGYVVSLRKCKTKNPRPELLITSNFLLTDVKNEAQEAENNASLPSDSFKLRPPRIDLKSGIWQSGSAVIYTLQSPMSIETSKCNVVDFKRDSLRRYRTTVEQESSDSDIVLIIEPFKELFYSQTQTVVQWDGSQASFVSTIELQAEEGRLYSLTAVLPEGLIIDQASSDEQPDMIEDWEIYPDAENPAKRTLTIYLRKSLCPGRNLVLNIRAHAIADWSKPVELNRLSPIVFERFESHTQILYVNVALNQRFVVGERVLYSPELRSWESGTLDDSTAPELPIGIDCSPHTTSGRGGGTGRIDAHEFCIDLKMWGNCLASLELAQSDYAVNANTTIWVDKNRMDERIELAFSGELSHLSQFRFSFGQASEAPSAWQGTLVWSNNRYKVKAEPIEGNVFSIEIPRNVSGPFTIFLNRKTDWKQQRVIDVLKSNDCSRLTTTVSVCSRRPQLFDVHTEGMKCVDGSSENNSDYTIGTFEYDLINKTQELGNDGGDSSQTGDPSASPRLKIAESKAPQSDVSIWAWDQIVEERHFASGNVLTSAQWTIENRYPPQGAAQTSDSSNTRLKITFPGDSTTQTFLTGVRIDNESVSGENIIQDSKNSCYILLPKKKLFVLTVQWTRYDKQMNNYSSFEPQKPILNIDVLQSSWNLYYPTSYRRLNSYMSSDPSVDGWLERFFGPLLRRDTPAIMEIVSQMWDDVQIGSQNQDLPDRGKENRDSASVSSAPPSVSVKSDSSSTLPVPYMLSGRTAWNCCQFDGRDAPKIIRIIRSEVSECIRWTFFVISISTILTLYFKRTDLLQLVKKKNDKQDADKPQSASWGFRRWICVFGGVCGVLCQTLPWFLSLPFSGAFLGTIVCLLVLAVPFDYEKINAKEESSSSLGKSSAVVKTSSRIAVPVSRFFVIAVLFIFQQSTLGQVPVLPGPDSRFIPPETPELSEYEIFIPVDQQNRPKSGYYVPQELLDLMQTRDNFSPERSWIVCRTQYFGKLIQKPRQTEAGLWKCAVEIETLVPNAAIELPIPLQETLSSTSSVSVSRGRIIKPSKPKTDEEESENSKSETLYWSWDKLDYQTVLQWNPKKDRWGIRLAQPGRYLIEAEFRPTIIAIDGKNEISFSIFECINSTFELIVPENITGLEFPGSYGAVKELTPNIEITDPSIPAQPGLKLKRVELGAAKRLSVRWNAGGFLSDGPVYDVDSMIWWNVEPDKADVRIKYNVKVVSGSVSSIEIKTDERLALLSSFSDDKQKKNNGIPIEENPELSANKELESGGDSSINENRKPGSGMQNSTNASRPSTLKTNSDAAQSDVLYSVIPNPDKPGSILVEFDRPITSQASFELHFIWKDALGVGRLQFPTTSVESSRSGQRTLAFTFDPELQFECASDSLSPMSAQSFWEQWRSFQKQTTSVTDNDNVSADRGNVRAAMDAIPDVTGDTDSAANRLQLPPAPQMSAELPTVAYDLNLSRRKTDSSGILDNVVMNVQRTKSVSDGTAEAFVLADYNRLLWQVKWSIDISRGECSGYNATLPDSFCKPENHLSIISASIKSFDNGVERVNTVSACIEGNELKMYWGTPIEGKCQLTLTGEIRPDFADEKSDSTRNIEFDFPEIKTLNVTQYKMAIGRADDTLIKTVFEKPTAKIVVWTQAELSVESPFSSRNQRLMETWQTTINDSSKKPCSFSVEMQRNDVAAEIDASVKLVQDGSSALTINGRVKISHGILDEFLLDIPENCAAPVSSKTTLKCELDALSITQRRYILRPLSPFTSDSEFELTIPLKKAESGAWKLEKQGPALWSLVRSGVQLPSSVQTSKQNKDNPAPTSEESKDALAETRPSDSVTKVFGLKMLVKPVSEAEYCASAEFACCVSGADSVRVRLPKGSKPLNIQIEQSSVRWIENKSGEMVIPMFTENAPVDIRIVYTAPFNRTLYTDPMKFEPPTIEDVSQPEILWMVIPWKNFGSADPGAVRTSSFINKQIWLINDLNSQFQFLQQSSGEASSASMKRLSCKLNAIEAQLKQYELRGEKPKIKNSSNLLLPKPDTFRRPHLTSTETKAIGLAMQNVYLLRGLINEKLKSCKNHRKTVDSVSSSINDSELLEFQSTPPLVATSAPGTTFVLSYSLPPAPTPNASIWQILSMLFIPVIIWLTFFPPEPFIIWRPPFVLGCLSVIWLLCFNLYGVSILLFVVALFDALNKFRQRSKRNVIPLSVR